MSLIIDFHAHAFADKIADKAVEQLASYYELEINNRGYLKDLLASADEAGISKIVLLAAATNAAQVQLTNDWMASAVTDRIIGFGSLHPDYKEFEAELERMKGLGLRGIKFHADFQAFDIDDPRMWPIYEAIGDRFLVMFHVGDKKSVFSHPARLARVLDAFPRLRAVAAHLGGWSQWQEAQEFIIGKNVYVDTSSTSWCCDPETAVKMIRNHGVDRVLFGTDYPILTHQEEVDLLLKLPLTDTEKEKILGLNAKELLEI